MDVRYAGSHIHVVAGVTHLKEADTHVENTDFIEQIHVIWFIVLLWAEVP